MEEKPATKTGYYTFEGIAPGDYTLFIERRQLNDFQETEAIAAQPIRVESGSITEIDLPFR